MRRIPSPAGCQAGVYPGRAPCQEERWKGKLRVQFEVRSLPPSTQLARAHYSKRSQSLNMSDNKAEGRRQAELVKQRTQMREDFERQKQTLINETEKARPSAQRFVGENDSMEESLKKHTVGLVRLEDFQQRRKEIEELKAREAAKTSELKYVFASVFPLAPFFSFLSNMLYRWLTICRIYLGTNRSV